MKKLFFALMAVVAISFTACSGSKGDAAAEVTESLEQGLSSGDANSFKDKLTGVVDKVKTLVTQNPEQAKEYLAKAQEFLKANADKVTALVGNNATIAGLVSAITEAKPDDVISGLFGAAVDKAQGAQDAVEGAVEGAQDAVEGAVEGAVQGAQDAVEGAVQGAQQAVEGAVQGAQEAAQQQVDQVKENVNEGLQKAVDQIKL